MLTWLFISAIALGVVVAVAVTSCEPQIEETQAGKISKLATSESPIRSDKRENLTA